MSQIYFSLVFHNHQPVGNFDFVFAEAYEKAYQPLTDCLDRHPTIQIAMHFTGPLLDWLKENQPAYLQQVAAQVQRGQLEILSGAYYEPVLAMLQDEDKLGQIQKLNEEVQQLFSTKSTGMWLAERIWEPYFPRPLHEAGIEYTIIDDTHFTSAGFSHENLFGYFVTEEQGHTIKLIPTQTKLRYLIPWRPVREVIAWLREQAETRQEPGKPPVWALIGDDGEKFGMWPQTYESIWGEKWMDQFFAALEENADWLHTIHPGEYVRRYRARGRAYIPTASYMEMGEWALPYPDSYYLRDLREQYELQLEHIPDWDRNKSEEIERVLHFLKGGFWRNFLVKYPEINHMQKRGQVVSRRLQQLPPGEKRDKAMDAIWASQCNCAYWHGVFGGVYLFHIRSANYTNIIRAETLLDNEEAIKIEQIDFNADSYDELLVSNGPLKAVIEPALGGMITELDYRPGFYNLLNIMSRHREGYHIQIQEAAQTNMLMMPDDDPNQFEGEPVRAKEKGLENHIYVDWHRHGLFLDHFLGDQTTLHGFESAQYPEQGDFVNQQYTSSVQQNDEKVEVTLIRNGNVWVGDLHVPVQIEKTMRMEKGKPHVGVRYRLINRGEVFLTGRFGVETAMGFDGGDSEQCYIEQNGTRRGLNESSEYYNVEKYTVASKLQQLALVFSLSQSAALWQFPLAPITLSEGGFERVHQGMVLLQWWPVNLAPGETWEFELQLQIKPMEQNEKGA